MLINRSLNDYDVSRLARHTHTQDIYYSTDSRFNDLLTHLMRNFIEEHASVLRSNEFTTRKDNNYIANNTRACRSTPKGVLDV